MTMAKVELLRNGYWRVGGRWVPLLTVLWFLTMPQVAPFGTAGQRGGKVANYRMAKCVRVPAGLHEIPFGYLEIQIPVRYINI